MRERIYLKNSKYRGTLLYILLKTFWNLYTNFDWVKFVYSLFIHLWSPIIAIYLIDSRQDIFIKSKPWQSDLNEAKKNLRERIDSFIQRLDQMDSKIDSLNTSASVQKQKVENSNSDLKTKIENARTSIQNANQKTKENSNKIKNLTENHEDLSRDVYQVNCPIPILINKKS